MKPQVKVMKKEWKEDWNRFNLFTNGVNKPTRAIWTSEYDEDLNNVGWIEWCKWNKPEWLDGYLYMIYPKPGIKVYEINDVDDYTSSELVKLDRPGMLYIDYQAMADKGYDGIHFTFAASLLGHSFMDIPINITTALNPIDCESTVWFNMNWVDRVDMLSNNLLEDKRIDHLDM
jgi:hypothetical protein